MKRQYRLANAALLGLSLALANHSALAAPGIHVGASVSQSTLHVIDLTPGDGAAAGYTISSASSSVMSGIDAPAAPWTQRNDAQSRLEPIAVTTSYAGSTAVSSADKFGETRTDVRLDDSVGTRGYANGDVRQIMSLTVAPRTQLIYTGYGEVSMSDAAQYGGAAFFGNAVATVTFGDQVWANGMMQDAMGHTDSGVRGEGFYLSFYNNTDTEKYTSVTLNILTRATFIAAAPVPEPATYAMFGLGTLMVGAMARRQRRRQRAA